MLSYGDSQADRACSLECVENLPPVHEFVGPVKIVLMDVPKSIYTKKMWISAAVGLAEMMIGATVMTILFYTLAFKTAFMVNFHVAICTIGMQLLMPAAILMQNSLHGPSTSLKQPDRNCQHLFLQFLGFACTGTGAILVIIMGPGTMNAKLTNIHSIAGLVTCGLAVIAAIFGPAAYCVKEGRAWKNVHAIAGVPALLASSVCFCIGVFTSKSLKAWVPSEDILYILLVLCGIYTIIVILMPLLKICGKAP